MPFERTIPAISAAVCALGIFAACGGDDSHGPSDGSTSDTSSNVDGSGTDVTSSDVAADVLPCTNGDPNLDQDGDGWTGAQGDCNDCDPMVNPGAVDVEHAVDGGTPTFTDDDCDGTAGNDIASCGEGLALGDVNADDAVKAIELCRRAGTTNRSWGVESAAYVRANGDPFATPGVQVGIQPAFGANVSPRSGGTMLMLSSGAARSPAQAGACGSSSCKHNATGTAPPGFPQNVSTCAAMTSIADDVALSVKVRVPTNAVGYSFDTELYTFGFAGDVCSPYSDQSVVLVNPAPVGAINGNVLFDSVGNAIGDDTAFVTACNPMSVGDYALDCTGGCPPHPNPYCPSGTSWLAGTGFDTYTDTYNGTYNGGATPWLRTTVPVAPGSEITLRFAIWDSSDQLEDSSVLFDRFHWITSGTVTTATALAP